MCKTKICSSCKKDKPINQFSNYTKSIDGKSNNCLVCMRRKDAQGVLRKKNKRLAVQDLKICSSCNKELPFTKFKSTDLLSSCIDCNDRKKEIKLSKKRKRNYKQPIKRKCACCKVKFPVEEFYKRGLQSNGHIKYGSYCRSCVCDRNRIWKYNNPEIHRKCMIAGWKKYRDENPDRYSAQRAKHRAVKIKATPIWFDEGKEAVVKMYAESIKKTKETGIMHHVDHIVPLNSKKVCGLHCVDNLQVLTAKENLIKSNLVWPDMW